MRYAVVRESIIVFAGVERRDWILIFLTDSLHDALMELRTWRMIAPEETFRLGA